MAVTRKKRPTHYPSDDEESDDSGEERLVQSKKAKKPRKKKAIGVNMFINEDVEVDDDEESSASEVEYIESVGDRGAAESTMRQTEALPRRSARMNKFMDMNEAQVEEYFKKRQAEEEATVDLDVSDSDDEASTSRSVKGQLKTHIDLNNFVVGDVVEVIGGEMQGVRGSIVSILQDVVTIIPDRRELEDPIQFSIHDLRKHFNVGDHVRVIAGRRENMTGTIVSIKDLEVILLSDSSYDEIRAFPRNIRLSKSVSTGLQGPRHMLNSKRDAPEPLSVNTAQNPRGRQRGRDPQIDRSIIGKTVRILMGPMKGYFGTAKDATMSTVSVELHAQPKIICVDRSRIKIVDGNETY